MEESNIKTDEAWKEEVAAENETMQLDPQERVWVPLDELETYFKGISTTLLGIVGNIETTIDKMKENVEQQKGENNDDNE